MARAKSSSIADRGVETKSRRLDRKHIALGVCGGIGAVEVVKIIRELRRHGARVTPFLTPSVERFITSLSIEWAAGEKPVLEAGPEVDHLDSYDLVLVAPATLNTISKSALGLADNAVSLLIASQLGRKLPLAFVPAMNSQLQAHPALAEYRKRLESWGARFHDQPQEEGRLKMPSPERLVDFAYEVLAEN